MSLLDYLDPLQSGLPVSLMLFSIFYGLWYLLTK
jgi:hypothetical protein